jgi:hypothetical protein
MSITFLPSTKEDTIGTIAISAAICSRFLLIETSTIEVTRFTLTTTALAAVINVIWSLVSIALFSYLHRKNEYESIGRLGYAWDHINFRSYKKKLLSTSRLLMANIMKT